jgi:hypothetical protein
MNLFGFDITRPPRFRQPLFAGKGSIGDALHI